MAAVLTGGASRRMGRDKASLPVDGVPMAVRVAEAARAAGAVEVVSIGAPVDGVAHRPDDHPGEGPLGAVLTALRWAGDRRVLVLSCDLVSPSPTVMQRAVDALGPAHHLAVPLAEGRPQWLHAAWAPPGPIDELEARFAAGERSIHRAAADLVAVYYDEPDLAALADADTPADLPPADR